MDEGRHLARTLILLAASPMGSLYGKTAKRLMPKSGLFSPWKPSSHSNGLPPPERTSCATANALGQDKDAEQKHAPSDNLYGYLAR
jgi:hypothetical protein